MESTRLIRLTGLVVCRDEAERIGACLDSLAFCDELVVVDSGSSDGTLKIVKDRGARLYERAWVTINDQKDFGRSVARGEWVLNLDADEVVSPELAQEIAAVVKNAGDVAAYRIKFRNYFRSVWVKRSGYYPDPHIRLLRRDRARWALDAPVHDRVLVDGAIGELAGHIDHYSFQSIDHFLAKSSRYASWFAAAAYARGRRAGVTDIALHTVARFFKAYVLQGGMFEGALGLTISGLQAYEVFQKYVRLWELTRFGGEARGAP